MKTRFLSFLLVTILSVPAIAGCLAAGTVESAAMAAERSAENVADAVAQPTETPTATASGRHKNPALSLEEAQSIALKHAGFTSGQVTALHTEYEIEHGIPLYDVEFHHGSWEYDYEIHADTGEILSYSKDD